MESVYLQTLVESIATGSFSKASENLCVTQSAVSRRIKFLEDQYGFALIDRSGPILVTTDAGRIVLEKAEKILSLEKELLHDLQEIVPKTCITFCCTPAFGIAYLPEIMKGFMLLNPGMNELRFFFDTPDKVVNGLREGIYQVGVIEHTDHFELSEFETFELPVGEVVFVSAQQLGLTEDELTIDELTRYDLYSRNEGCCSKKLLDYSMKKIGCDYAEFNRVVFYDDLHLIINAVHEGCGIAFISRSIVKQQLESGIFRAHRVRGFEHGFQQTLIVNNAPSSFPLLSGFITTIQAIFETSTPPQNNSISLV